MNDSRSKEDNQKNDGEPSLTRSEKHAITRRAFLKYTAGAGTAMGLGPGLAFSGVHEGEESDAKLRWDWLGKRQKTERRIYLFNLDPFYVDTSDHEVIMVAGKNRQPLRALSRKRLKGRILKRLRRRHPILHHVPDTDITHMAVLRMPRDAIQLCYLQRIRRSARDGGWDMALMFYHLPIAALRSAQTRRSADAPAPVRWTRYGLTGADLASLADPVGENMLMDTSSQAIALVASYPEISCGEADNAAYIQCNIIATQPSTQTLAEVISAQGSATPTGGWATQTPLIDPDTGQQAVNSMGQLQYLPVWSDETNQWAGQAISPALTTVKGDTTLGVNITDVDPTEVNTLDASESTNGAIWTVHDGMPTVDQSPNNAAAPQDTGFAYKFSDQSPGHGYSITVSGVTGGNEIGTVSANVTFTAKNWYLRYLSLYVRYLDSDGNPIAVSDVVSLIGTDLIQDDFPLYACCQEWNGTYDMFLNLVSPEYEILGIPVKTTTVDYTIPVPASASSVLILAGGMGRGSNPFSTAVIPGATMTGLFDLSLPSLFLALNAAAGLTSLSENLQNASKLLSNLPLVLQLFADTFEAISFDDPQAFASLGVSIGEKLLGSSAKPLVQLVAEAIAEGETIDDILDAVPVIGTFLAAVAAIGTIAEITETSAEVAQSPKTYVGEIKFTHDITVTIKAPNAEGFPATATYFKVTAIFDGGTPHTITQDLSSTTATTQTVTFTSVPLGGQVSFSVGLYSTDNWLAGKGSVGPIFNGQNIAPAIDTTENLVPLSSSTVYTQKELIALDADGNHGWQATTTPPSETAPNGCNPIQGQLCALAGITVSTATANVGYAWQSYNDAVTNCSSGDVSQLHQFANLSVGEDPQSEYLFSDCGFSGTARVVYNLLGNDDFNFYLDPTTPDSSTGEGGILRQIRLSGSTASYDGPSSNLAWGQLIYDADALLLHPAGQIISINSEKNKIEVLKLPAVAVADADAPLSQVYAGQGIREGLMNGPTHAALAPDGSILILETANNRIQAFDLHANPAPIFANGAYFVPLKDTPGAYLDLAVENTGYMYVLSQTGEPGSYVFRLDIYTPAGTWLVRTTGVNAARLAVNYWRDIFTLNYQVLKLPNGSLPERTEPSVGHWIPSTP